MLGNKLEAMFGGEFGEQPTLTFFVLLFVLPQSPFCILQPVTQHPVIEFCELASQRLGCHQSPLATADASNEASQAFIYALDQTPGTGAKEPSSAVTLTLDRAFALSTLPGARG